MVELIDDRILVKECKSGTCARIVYDCSSTASFVGIILKDIDGENCIIYDVESGEYLSDVDNYFVLDELDATIIVSKSN